MIGLVGGLGIAAGVFYYEGLVRRCVAAGVSPEILVVHPDIRRAMHFAVRNDRDGLAAYLADYLAVLQRAGVRCIAIGAVTPHMAVPALQRRYDVPIVSVVDSVRKRLGGTPAPVAVFGTRAVIESKIYGALDDANVMTPDDETVSRINDVYTSIAFDPKAEAQAKRRELDEIARELISTSGVELILLAGTDLSAFYQDQKPPYPHLDVAEAHLDDIVSFWLSNK